MKLVLILIISCLEVSLQAAVEYFDAGSIDTTKWTYENFSPPGKASLSLEGNKLNFLYAGLTEEPSGEEGYQRLRLKQQVSSTQDFRVSVDVELQALGDFLTMVGLGVSASNGQGLFLYDLTYYSGIRSYIDDRAGANYSYLEEAENVYPGGTVTLRLDYLSSPGIFQYSMWGDDQELSAGSVGIAQNAGSMGLINWNLSQEDGFLIDIYGGTFGVDVTSGQMTMDNFVLSQVPEPQVGGLLIAIAVFTLSHIYRRRQSR